MWCECCYHFDLCVWVCVCVCVCVRARARARIWYHATVQQSHTYSVHFYTSRVTPGHCVRKITVFVHCEYEITAEWRKFHSQEHHIGVLIKVIKEMTMGWAMHVKFKTKTGKYREPESYIHYTNLKLWHKCSEAKLGRKWCHKPSFWWLVTYNAWTVRWLNW